MRRLIVVAGALFAASTVAFAPTAALAADSTATVVVSSANPSVFGQSVTFSTTVPDTTDGAAFPTGTVTYTIDGGAPTTVPLQNNGGPVLTAQLTISTLGIGSHTVAAAYTSNDPTFSNSSGSLGGGQNVNQASTTTTVVSSANPGFTNQAVTFTATVTANAPGAGNPTGTVTFTIDGGAPTAVPLQNNGGPVLTAKLTTSALPPGPHSITAVYGGDGNDTGSTSTLTQTVNAVTATTTALISSRNPSQVGQAVTFTATVTGGGGTPTGTVTFNDGATALGSGTLSGGVATFTTSSLTLGSHAITAVYAGTVSFTASTSPVLVQAVNTLSDSLKLRALQVLAAPVAAQASGQAISGAVDAAITEGFSNGGGALVTPNAGGMRFNFAGDPDGKPTDHVARSSGPFNSANGSLASNVGGSTSARRVDDAFGALAYAGPTKAPRLRYVEPRDWLGWAELRGASLDRWGAGTGVLGTAAGVPMLYGSQVNLLAGLTRRLLPNFLIGVLGGYETFDYRSDALQGRLKGDGWTVGSYLGWKITQNIRFDAAAAYSGIGYDGSAGTASGNFNGNRWLLSSGLTGTYQSRGLLIEPSARVYALWENENAYTDSLGTLQSQRNFSTGRASAGVKLAYPIAWSPTMALAPYAGLYGDYYFNTDSATGAVAAATLPAVAVLDGWSARAIGGVTASFGGGAQVAVGAERSGIGGDFGFWTYRARASVPFGAQ